MGFKQGSDIAKKGGCDRPFSLLPKQMLCDDFGFWSMFALLTNLKLI